MFKRVIHIFVLMVFIGACTPATTTPKPETPGSDEPPSTPMSKEPPEIEEPPLPVIPSERDHHPYNWLPEDVKGLDPWGDSESDATDIVAIYQREKVGNVEFRLDILNFEDDELAPIYLAIDFLEGGSSQVKPESSLSFEIEWELLVSVVGGEFRLYDVDLTVISDQLTTTEINHQLDFVFFAISESAFAGWDGEPFQIQALLLDGAHSAVMDSTSSTATDNPTGRSKLLLTFFALFFGNNPSQAAAWYDGYHWEAFGDRPDVRPGETRGLKYLLDAVERYEIPLNQGDTFFDQFPGSEYIRLNERFRHLADKSLYEPRMTLGFGHYMPWQPDDVDAKAIEITLAIREELELPVSDVFYPYEGLLSPEDIQVIKEAGFEAIYAHDQALYSFFGELEDWSNPAVVREYFKARRKIHQFNDMKVVFWNWFDFATDDRWGATNWPADEYEWFTGTDQGLHLWWRRILLDMAIDLDQEQYYTIGTDLHFSTWLFPEIVEWNFQWLASHPWIEVTTFDSILDRGWQAIDHGELDVPPDEPLWRYQIEGDTHYNVHFPQHYYGGIADGHSPLVPAGEKIEAYYDYIPYLRDGELIPSGRIMGDDMTPGSIIYETLANLREAPDNPLTTIAWLAYFNQIGEQTFHEGPALRDDSRIQANLINQVNKVVAAAQWAAEADKGTLAIGTQVYDKDLDLDGELEFVMSNDRIFAVFENDGGRLEYAFAYHPDYGPIQLIGPSSQFPFQQGADFRDGEVTNQFLDGAFMEDLDSDGYFEFEVLSASIEDPSLTFTYNTRPVTKTYTLEGDSIRVHYELGSDDRLNLGFTTAVHRLGVYDKDWIWNFESVEMEEVRGWQMASGGSVLLNVEDLNNIQTDSFFDSPARQEMRQWEDESNYPPGHWNCFPCGSITIWDTQEVDFSLTLSAAPFDISVYTPITTPKPSAPPLTPGPTSSPGQLESGPVVYDDGLTEGWSLDPWSGTADLFSTASVYEGSNAIVITLEPNGAVTFDNASFDTSPYDYMVFNLNGGASSDQELYVEMKSGDGTSLGKADLADYLENSPLQPGEWHRAMIPLSALNPGLGNFGWFDVGDASGNGAATFHIDEIRFVTTEP